MDKRKSYLAEIKGEPTPVNKLKRAFQVIELDREIIAAYRDTANFQAANRQRLIAKLKPLSENLNLTE